MFNLPATSFLSALFLAFFLSSASAGAALPTIFSGEDLLVSNETLTQKAADAARGTVLVFLSAKCPCSAGHEPALRALAKEYSLKGFKFVGVHSNRDESVESARSHFKLANLGFPVIEDGSGKEAPLATAFGALKTPHVFIVSREGELLFSGGVDDSKDPIRAQQHYLRDALLALSEGRIPEVKESRTLGCVIHKNTEE